MTEQEALIQLSQAIGNLQGGQRALQEQLAAHVATSGKTRDDLHLELLAISAKLDTTMALTARAEGAYSAAKWFLGGLGAVLLAFLGTVMAFFGSGPHAK
jgi:hypothetical protein